MQQNVRTLQDYLSIVYRRRSPMVLVAGGLLLLAIATAVVLPSTYRSAAIILIEQQEIPSELVRSTVSTYADQRIETISQRVMTSANLTEVIRKFDLYSNRRKSDPTETLVERLRKDIKRELISADVVDPRLGRTVQATIAFSVSFESSSPELAQKVANELVSLYLNENLKTRNDSARETSVFLTSEAEKLSKQMVDLENTLAAFKERNVTKLPELAQMNLQLMERTEREVTEIERQLSVLEERRIYLESQLAQISPHAIVYAETGERILAPEGRLKALETKETSMAALYVFDHPDLIKSRKEIAALRKELDGGNSADALEAQLRATRAELADARQKYSAEHPDIQRLERSVGSLEAGLAASVSTRGKPVKPDNPAYIQLQAQLETTHTELRSQRENQRQLKTKLISYENRLTQTPRVEGQYRALARDYENAQRKYQEIRAKQMEAQLAQSLESESKGERFTLIEPPLFPEKPVRPNRPVLLLLGVMVSFAGGIGTAAVAESVDSSVRSARDLSGFMGMLPLGVIPYIENDMDHQRKVKRRVLWWRGVAVMAGMILLGIVLVHWLIIPLDVLWFSALRRLGI